MEIKTKYSIRFQFEFAQGTSLKQDCRPMKERSWFRIHLSTAIVVMLSASGLLWANLREHIEEGIVGWETVDGALASMSSTNQGWPMYFRQSHSDSRAFANWFPHALIVDIVVAGLLLIVIALSCEAINRARVLRASDRS